MFDLGWAELLVVGIVALIVVGPKDLPVMFRTLGQFAGKARSMAREFTSAMNAAADDAGVKDIQRDLKDMANPKSMGMNKLKDAADAFEKWDPMADQSSRTASTPPSDSPATKPSEGPATAALRKERTEQAAANKADAAARADARADAAGHDPEPKT